MPISRITAYIIGTRDDIVVSAGGPDGNGKWMGWITLGQEDRFRPLLNSEAIYNTSQEATEAMLKVVDEVRQKVHEECGSKHPIEVVFDEIKKETP